MALKPEDQEVRQEGEQTDSTALARTPDLDDKIDAAYELREKIAREQNEGADVETDAPADGIQQEAGGDGGSPQPSVAPDDHVVTVTVNGKEVQTTVGQLRQNAALHDNAQQRFATATALLQQAQQQQQAIIKPPETEEQDTPERAGATEDGEEPDFKEIADQIQLGSPEDVANALRDFYKKGRSSVVDKTALVQEVSALHRQEVENQQTYSAIQEQYPHITEDRGLNVMLGYVARQIRDHAETQSQQTGQAMPSIRDIAFAAAQQVDEWWKGRGSAPGQPEQTNRQNAKVQLNDGRIEAKGRLNQPLPAHGGAYRTESPADGPDYVTDEEARARKAIAEIQASRRPFDPRQLRQ